jgi:hypothetical protein
MSKKLEHYNLHFRKDLQGKQRKKMYTHTHTHTHTHTSGRETFLQFILQMKGMQWLGATNQRSTGLD